MEVVSVKVMLAGKESLRKVAYSHQGAMNASMQIDALSLNTTYVLKLSGEKVEASAGAKFVFLIKLLCRR